MPSTRKTKPVIDEDTNENEPDGSESVKQKQFIAKEQDQWLFIANNEIVAPDPNTPHQPVVCGLRHPRSDKKCLFLFNNGDKDIYEVVQFKEEYRSWFIGETVHHDGSLFVTTPVDPVFLLLPYLIKAAQVLFEYRNDKSEKFMTLDQILIDEDYPECQRLQCCCPPDHIENVSDVKGDDDFKAYRYNKDKTLSWLKSKTESVSRILEEKNMCVSGAVTAEMVQSKASEEEYRRYAFGIVSEYLPVDLASTLREYLGIPVVKEKRPSDAKNPPSKRVKLEDITPNEDYSNLGKHDNKPSKGKQSVAQKKLDKVDKSGMKSMMSFFSPKAKT